MVTLEDGLAAAFPRDMELIEMSIRHILPTKKNIENNGCMMKNAVSIYFR